MKLSDFVLPAAIIPQLKSANRDEVITELIDALIAGGAAAKSLRKDLISSIIEREKSGSVSYTHLRAHET